MKRLGYNIVKISNSCQYNISVLTWICHCYKVMCCSRQHLEGNVFFMLLLNPCKWLDNTHPCTKPCVDQQMVNSINVFILSLGSFIVPLWYRKSLYFWRFILVIAMSTSCRIRFSQAITEVPNVCTKVICLQCLFQKYQKSTDRSFFTFLSI